MHDETALNFLVQISKALVKNYGVQVEDANRRVAAYWNKPICGNHIIYHESPDYWAGAIYHGKRDFWRDCYTIADLKKAVALYAGGCDETYDKVTSHLRRCRTCRDLMIQLC